jgi:catechol 2,3-dioxygenase-like lactoylglutathione lyase family enzyme
VKHAIDHLVLCVDDLEGARAFYQRLGFTLTPRGEQPFGTANHLAQLHGNFLELLAVADRTRIPAPRREHFSFGGFNAGFLGRRQGMSMLVFPTDDARQDQQMFASRGLETYAPFDFSRPARLPGGGEAIVSFSLAFVTHPSAPEAAFFACQQHTPQLFWKPEYQRHANGARSVVEVMMVADTPALLADFFGRLLDPAAVTSNEDGLRIALEGGAIMILDPEQVKARHALTEENLIGTGPRFAGFAVAVRDMDGVEASLQTENIPFTRVGGRLQIAPRDAFGVLLQFCPATP